MNIILSDDEKEDLKCIARDQGGVFTLPNAGYFDLVRKGLVENYSSTEGYCFRLTKAGQLCYRTLLTN